MESPTSARLRPDELRGGDDAASTLSWPLRETIHHDVVDLPAAASDFEEEAAFPPPPGPGRPGEFPSASDTASLRVVGADTGEPRRISQLARVAIVALAAVALIEGIVIALQLTGSDAVRQAAVSARERLGLERAGAPVATAATATSAPSTHGAAQAPPPAAADAARDAGGELQVQSDRAGVTVIVDGERRGIAPLTVQGLAPGSHRVRLVEGHRSVEQTVVVRPDVATTLVMPLGRAAAAAGWMELVMPFEVQIFEEGRLVGTSAQSRLQFPAGEHRFELTNDTVGYRAEQSVRVRPGEVATVRPAIPTGLLSINAIPWAEVWIDGRQAGTTPLGNVRVPLGAHEVRFRHPEHGDETRRVLVTSNEPARVSHEFRP